MRTCLALNSLLASSLLVFATAAQSEPAKKVQDPFAVTFTQRNDRCVIEIAGKPFTESLSRGNPSPILYPIHGAKGIRITRDYPMHKGDKTEATDHPHHRSLWFTHGSINGHDFWAGKGRIEQVMITPQNILVDGHPAVRLTSNNEYRIKGELICRDTRTLTFHANTAGRFIDYEIRLHASAGDVVFGDTKEGSMAIRLTPELRLKGKVAGGKAENSEGLNGKGIWGKRASWVDYYGVVDRQLVGIAIFDHPSNHGYPCRWHARDYGLVAANPWGIHHFERKPKGTGDMTLAKNTSMRLRYRFFFHPGTTRNAGVAAQYKRFTTNAARPGAISTGQSTPRSKPPVKR